jgi:hypothetical protein
VREGEVEGYDVIANDDSKVGEVVGLDDTGAILIVEHGLLRKKRNALPRQLAHVDDQARVVRVGMGKDVLLEAPEVEGDEVDQQFVNEYYGIAGDQIAPTTQGEGVLTPDDPARSAEDEAHRLGVRTAEEERLHVRKHDEPGEGPLDRGHSPGFTGGDRFADAEATRDER